MQRIYSIHIHQKNIKEVQKLKSSLGILTRKTKWNKKITQDSVLISK